jgi:hypothetical protein
MIVKKCKIEQRYGIVFKKTITIYFLFIPIYKCTEEIKNDCATNS